MNVEGLSLAQLTALQGRYNTQIRCVMRKIKRMANYVSKNGAAARTGRCLKPSKVEKVNKIHCDILDLTAEAKRAFKRKDAVDMEIGYAEIRERRWF